LSKARQYYLLALLLALLLHGSLLSFTTGNTYDAYVHMFFGSHYADGWFESWNYKWYTGFSMTGYPPLVHQVIALFSYVIGLKAAFILWALIAIALFIRGIYHFSRIWVSELSAGYACLLAVLSSSYIEAVHIFGQLPSITGIALLLNACPELYKWLRHNRWSYFITGCSIIACLTCAHHVTTIFGMVFFIAPVLGVAVLDLCILDKNGIENVRILDFIQKVIKHFPKAILIGTTIIAITVIMIFPYWYLSKTDPILQISIPHGSRANFIEEPSLGMVFFIIPWGVMLFFLPGIFQKLFHKRNVFLGLSFLLLFILGTGGTTAIPKMILGENAFNILTLDRFTFWASIIALPFFGELIRSLVEGDLASSLKQKAGALTHKIVSMTTVICLIIVAALVVNFANFKPLQPAPIDVDPIVSFMERDGHDRWRYLTLGFGDQMAWLSANTSALSVDGNYHSARRLPELTTRAVERIENSKYLGEEGLGALRNFLSFPEKYHLKYIFSNDKFYEPLLYFYGWSKLKPLENNIAVWERKDVKPLPTILPKKEVPLYQKLMWGIIPLSSLLFALFINFGVWFARKDDREKLLFNTTKYKSTKAWYGIQFLWVVSLLSLISYKAYKVYETRDVHQTSSELIHSYYHALDFKKYDEAFTYLEKTEQLSFEQYCLELSLEDGILASYAKLDTLELKAVAIPNDNHKIILVKAHWFTAIQKYVTEEKLDLIKKDGRWYIRKKAFEKSTPAIQLLNLPDINFHNQGRRKAEAGATYREDILDRPNLYITQSNLVKRNGQYHVVGELVNIDNDPCHLSVEAQLYNDEGKLLMKANANEVIVHSLLPKESTAFRIDFDRNRMDSFELSEVHSFAVFARAMVTDDKLYKFYGWRNAEIEQGILKGNFDNYGNNEISIPQLIISTSKDGVLRWVDSKYIDRGVRPQREKPFSSKLINPKSVFVKAHGQDNNLLVNGSYRSEFQKLLPKESNKSSSLNYKDLEIKLYTNGLVSN